MFEAHKHPRNAQANLHDQQTPHVFSTSSSDINDKGIKKSIRLLDEATKEVFYNEDRAKNELERLGIIERELGIRF